MVQNNTQTGQSQSDLAVVKKSVVDIVTNKVRQFVSSGELVLPADYTPENALKAAFLVLQDTVDRDKNPVLQSCTQNSISLALLDMIVMGLNPIKNQCYFIAYGKNLACQQSYFGSMALAKRLDDNVDDFAFEIVYEGDDLEYDIIKGKKNIVSHKQKLENISNDKIIAAYCMALDADGNIYKSELMTFEEIKQSWKQSKMNPVLADGKLNPKSTHAKFTRDMALKTVINKLCKPLINASSDSQLLKGSVKRATEIAAESEFSEEVEQFANKGDVIDVEPEEVEETTDNQTQPPEQEPEPEPKRPSYA